MTQKPMLYYAFEPSVLSYPVGENAHYMPGSLMGLPPLAHFLARASIWSEVLEWNPSFVHKAEDVTSPRLYAPGAVRLVPHFASLPLHHLKGPDFCKKYKESIPDKAKHSLKPYIEQVLDVVHPESIQLIFECLLSAGYCARQKKYKTNRASYVKFKL